MIRIEGPLDVLRMLFVAATYVVLAMMILGVPLTIIDWILPGSPLGLQAFIASNPSECRGAQC